MNLRTLTLCTVVLALTIPAFAAQKSPMKPGKWQITIEMEVAGMPAKMAPIIMTHCITKEEAENPQPPKANDSEECKVSNYNMSGNTISWSVKCEKQNMTGEGTITFSGDTYDGEAHLKMSDVEITQKYAGKYLGACDQ